MYSSLYFIERELIYKFLKNRLCVTNIIILHLVCKN